MLVGAITALLFGGQVGTCLGPLGVTAVQCAKATGVMPDASMGLPVLAVTIVVATFLVAPAPTGSRMALLVGGILGGAIGGAAFLVQRPLTMEGFDSRGIWISIPRPVDAAALATAVIFGAFLGGILRSRMPPIQRRRSTHS